MNLALNTSATSLCRAPSRPTIQARVKKQRGPVRLYNSTTGMRTELTGLTHNDFNNPIFADRMFGRAQYLNPHFVAPPQQITAQQMIQLPEQVPARSFKPNLVLITTDEIDAVRQTEKAKNPLVKTAIAIVDNYRNKGAEMPEALHQRITRVIRDESVPMLFDNLMALGVISQFNDMGISLETNPFLVGTLLPLSIIVSEKAWFLFSQYLEKHDENPNTPMSYMLSYNCLRNSNLPLDVLVHDSTFKALTFTSCLFLSGLLTSASIDISPETQNYITLGISNIAFVAAAIFAAKQEPYVIEPVRTHLMDPAYKVWKNSTGHKLWKASFDFIFGEPTPESDPSSLISKTRNATLEVIKPLLSAYEDFVAWALDVFVADKHQPSRNMMKLGTIGALSTGGTPSMAMSVLITSAAASLGLAIKNT